MFKRIGRLATLSFILLLVSEPGGILAQEANKVEPPGKEASPKQKNKVSRWTVQCANKGDGFTCKLIQQIILKKTKQLILGVVIQKSPVTKKSSLLLQLPHGLYLPAGVRVQIDKNKEEKHVIQTCDGKGCYVGFALGNEKIAAMSKGHKFIVQFQNLNKKNIKVPIPLYGFTAGFKKL